MQPQDALLLLLLLGVVLRRRGVGACTSACRQTGLDRSAAACLQMRRNFFSLAPKYLRLVRAGACFLHAQEAVLHGRRLNLLQWQRDAAPPKAASPAAAAAAGRDVMLHEIRCTSSGDSSNDRVLRMQGLVGMEFAADCQEILPRARDALHRWKHRQQQQQQEGQQQTQTHSGEEQFYAQVS